MSFDPGAEKSPFADSPNTQFEQPKSGKKWWMIFGFGCLGFVVICCGGGGILGYIFLAKPAQEMQSMILESQGIARTSEIVAGAVGEPVAVADKPNELLPKMFVEDGVNKQEIRFAVTGSQTKGDLVLKIKMLGPFKFERESLSLELENGSVIDLDSDDEFELDIDTGNGTDEQ